MAVIEYSRNILGYTQANSTEMNEGTTSCCQFNGRTKKRN
jgi:CTP synthase (UTP-ammonia lyase)